jgi:hypothetical protein
MGWLKAPLAFLILILRTLLFEWVVRLIELLRILGEWIELCLLKRRLPPRLRKTPPQSCSPISDPAYKRPDPMIYDQYYVMAQGFAVTWDNPDIWRKGRRRGLPKRPAARHRLRRVGADLE